MASGSSGRGNSVSKGFDFGSDDILCSYDDFANRDSNSNGNHTDPVMAPNSTKDFNKSRMARTCMFPASAYNPPEDSLSQDVIATVEKSMKKYADNLMRFLEGISSRLSQLELYCYNLDKSIGEMRSDLNRDHGEQDSKLKSLEKHIQEVHRSVQILRDKQELAETQKELAKLQLAQKESSSSSHPQSNEERSSPSITDSKKTDNASDAHNQQLALALPHQIAPQQQPAAPQTQTPAPNVTQATQQPPYYMPPPPQAVAQLSQNQYLPSDQQYRAPQLQQPTPSQVTPSPPAQQYSQYQQPQQQLPQPPQQQQWPQQVQPPQQPSMQPQMRPPSSSVYPPYQPSQATNQSPTETLPNSMPMQMAYSGVPPPGSSRADTIPYGYGGAGRTVPQQSPPQQQIKGSYTAQGGDMYGTSGTHPALPPPPPGSAYMMYDGEGGRTHLPPPQPHFAQGGYPPTSASLQNPTGHNLMVRNPSQSQFARNHPYNELIEKLASMGFRGEHVASVIQRMEESGQPIDFNSVLDRLNVHGSVGPQRGWSG
ncbi:uncharacterized protein LOC133292133 [Gastrolobium bilobum]|uniref:uncharacterized protein LOC133292133 n=1 Tax=Gastrolobium bilobum TaxID=150636 RepID=UPI002AB10FD8|nr:uncharacterized protein LOC133292133 [Gastrolobium bilobum]